VMRGRNLTYFQELADLRPLEYFQKSTLHLQDGINDL
jgi:hypothetical protein